MPTRRLTNLVLATLSVIGLVLVLLGLTADRASAQAGMRLFGTSSTGRAVPVLVNSDGTLATRCQ